MADSSSKLVKALFSSNKGGGNKTNFDIGKINPRILKILGVSEFDIENEQEYLSLLKEKMLLIIMGKSKLSRDDEILIQEEVKRLRSKKFSKKKITADSFKKGTSVGMNFGLKKITAGITPTQALLPPAVDKMSGKSDIQEIIDALSIIIEQLTLFNKLSGDEKERGRRERENRRRREREGELEKGFDGVMKAAEKVIAPVKSILDRIINFLVMTLIGRSLILILRWFGDPENKKKVEAIGRFLGDHWPKLLALFIAFGTGLGGFVRGLIGVVIKGTGALIKGAFWLAKKAGIKGAAGALKFLGGPKGKLIGAGLELGAVALGTVALSKGLENFGGIGEEQQKEKTTPVQTFSGGGFASLKNLFGNIGGFFGNMKKMGTDTIAAVLTPGEVVMSKPAVDYWGADTLLGMNKIGGGDNKPKVVEGATYAAGGGMVGDGLSKESKAHSHNNKPTFGPGATPQMSSQEDMNRAANKIRIEDRIKRIENQIQVSLALSKGQGVNIRGATAGAQLGTGYKTIHQGRDAVVIKGGGKNFSTGIGDREITLGGKRYYAQKRGNDVIYVLRDTRNLQSPGMFGAGGMFGGPRNSARMDYAASKGKYYSSSDQKTYGNYNDALAAKNSRLTSLASQQRLDKLSRKGGTGGSSGIRYDTEMEAFQKEQNKRGGIFGGIGRGFTRMFGTGEQIEKINAQDKASQARVKQAGAASIGRYYSSSDGKYYKDYNAAVSARKERLAKIAPTKPKPVGSGVTPPSKPKVSVKYTPAGGGMGGKRGSGSSPSTATPKVPQFSSASSSRSRRRTASTYGIG
jgi:hypothetical protein